jgi:hypothetical protein
MIRLIPPGLLFTDGARPQRPAPPPRLAEVEQAPVVRSAGQPIAFFTAA